MALQPQGMTLLLSYEGGTISGTKAVLEKIFGNNLKTTWLPPIRTTESGRRIFRYGRRQRSQAAAGRVTSLRFTDGEVWTVRLTGSDVAFIDKILSLGDDVRVVEVWSQKGTIYGQQVVLDDGTQNAN